MHGRFAGESFLPWMERHAGKLGLENEILTATETRIELALQGPQALIDAMEMACSLGPIDIWVEEIESVPLNEMPSTPAQP